MSSITPQILLKAYAAGIFPMAESADDSALYWIEPELRGVIPLDRFHLPRSLAKQVRRRHFDIRIDGDRPWDVRVHDERLYQRVLAHGTLGLGEAYMDGWWSCASLDDMVCRAQRADVPARLLSPTTIARIVEANSAAQEIWGGRAPRSPP